MVAAVSESILYSKIVELVTKKLNKDKQQKREKNKAKRTKSQKSSPRSSQHEIVYLEQKELKRSNYSEKIIIHYDIPFEKLQDGKVCVRYMHNNKEVTQNLDFTARRDVYPKKNSLLDLL